MVSLTVYPRTKHVRCRPITAQTSPCQDHLMIALWMCTMKVKKRAMLKETRVLITIWDGTSFQKNRRGNERFIRLPLISLIPHSHQGLNTFKNCLVKQFKIVSFIKAASDFCRLEIKDKWRHKLKFTWILCQSQWFSFLLTIFILLNLVKLNMFCWCEWGFRRWIFLHCSYPPVSMNSELTKASHDILIFKEWMLVLVLQNPL